MANISAKFDEEAQKGLVSIMYTSLLRYMSIVTLTFDLWPLQSSMKRHTAFTLSL